MSWFKASPDGFGGYTVSPTPGPAGCGGEVLGTWFGLMAMWLVACVPVYVLARLGRELGLSGLTGAQVCSAILQILLGIGLVVWLVVGARARRPEPFKFSVGALLAAPIVGIVAAVVSMFVIHLLHAPLVFVFDIEGVEGQMDAARTVFLPIYFLLILEVFVVAAVATFGHGYK